MLGGLSGARCNLDYQDLRSVLADIDALDTLPLDFPTEPSKHAHALAMILLQYLRRLIDLRDHPPGDTKDAERDARQYSAASAETLSGFLSNASVAYLNFAVGSTDGILFHAAGTLNALVMVIGADLPQPLSSQAYLSITSWI